MPLVHMPPDGVLAALGKMVLHFGDLEYWINIGVIEGEHITDPEEQKAVGGRPFASRIERLKSAFANAKSKAWIDEVFPAVDFSQITVIADDRNNLLHGATFSVMTRCGTSIEGHHWNINPNPKKADNGRYLTKNYLDELTDRISQCSERIQWAVLNLCLAKRRKGIGTLSGGC